MEGEIQLAEKVPVGVKQLSVEVGILEVSETPMTTCFDAAKDRGEIGEGR